MTWRWIQRKSDYKIYKRGGYMHSNTGRTSTITVRVSKNLLETIDDVVAVKNWYEHTNITRDECIEEMLEYITKNVKLELEGEELSFDEVAEKNRLYID